MLLSNELELNPKILIVDDSKSSLKQLSDAVTGLGDIYFATDGESALLSAKIHKPDLILLDIKMPNMSGLEVCKKLKQNRTLAKTAIVFVTGDDQYATEVEALQLGGVDFIAKPYHRVVLRARVHTHLALARKTKQLERTKNYLAELVNTLPVFISYWTREKRNLFCNDMSGKWFGFGATEMHNQPLSKLFNRQTLKTLEPHIEQALAGDNQLFEMAFPSPIREITHAQITIIGKQSIDLNQGFLLIATDISERKLVEQRLSDEKEKLSITLNSIDDAVIATDKHGTVNFINPIAEKLTGWVSGNTLGKPIEQVMNIVDGSTNQPIINPVRDALKHQQIINLPLDTVLISLSGKRFEIEDSAAPIINGDNNLSGTIIVFHDLSKVREAEAKMTHLKHYDSLTNLPNRTLFFERLNHAISQYNSRSTSIALLIIDIDDFKNINDLHGHKVGDQLLQKVAELLTDFTSPSDTVSRQGGDEFVILLKEISSNEQLSIICKQIIAAFAQPWQINRLKLSMTVSIGVALFPQNSSDPGTLYKQCNAAMFAAKRNGKNNYQIFSPEIERHIQNKIEMEERIRQGIKNKEFTVFYQPKVQGQTNKIVGAEALARWIQPDGTIVPPLDFIGLAEENGLIIPLGELILHKACTDAWEWLKVFPDFRIAVNISAIQFNEDIVKTIQQVLDETGSPASALELELTESILVKEKDAVSYVKQLKELGVMLSLDDFGTGYSSLSYIKIFPLDILKIDQSFVKGMLDDPVDASIVKTIIQLSSGLGLALTAEGVEQKAQMDELIELDCGNFQGFYFSKPVPKEQMSHLLKNGLEN